ncbi:MAG: triose-phosphate isomerase [Gemmatimonadetes bacterium]|nr:triose-phosphate isomerase [Gemmatimonadota bacterium]MDA1104322.1 triose-phosphate isomerase [Gemmatimonadota bacterium]
MAVIAGNWKMHMGPVETTAFFEALRLEGVPSRHELLLFPPAISLLAAARAPSRDRRIQLGVQNIHWEDQGAFTGEVSAGMAAGAGATFVLIGHSERRHVFGESDQEVALKVGAAQRNGLVPVICVGETLDERRAGRVEEVILRQLDAVLPTCGTGGSRFLIAYEPVWAIGTGETATPGDASAAHATLRTRLEGALGISAATRVPLLYGGSVKPGNAAELMAAAEVDGVLVGGASLDPKSFAEIASAGG